MAMNDNGWTSWNDVADYIVNTAEVPVNGTRYAFNYGVSRPFTHNPGKFSLYTQEYNQQDDLARQQYQILENEYAFFYQANPDFPLYDEETYQQMLAYSVQHYNRSVITPLLAHLCWQAIKKDVYARIDAGIARLNDLKLAGLIERGEVPNKTQIEFGDDIHYEERVE
jgi:hypothetical protein